MIKIEMILNRNNKHLYEMKVTTNINRNFLPLHMAYHKVQLPKLVLIYINDIGKITKFEIISYANVTTLYIADQCFEDMYIHFHEDLNRLAWR